MYLGISRDEDSQGGPNQRAAVVPDLDPLRRRRNDRAVREQGPHHTLRVTGKQNYKYQG